MSLFTLGSAFNRFFRNELVDKIRAVDGFIDNLNKRIDNISQNSGNSIVELVDARKDENGVVHPNIKRRIDTISAFTTEEIQRLKKENAKMTESISASGIPVNAGAPTFTRPVTRIYKGRTYQVNEPVYDIGGLLIDPTMQESLTIPTTNILNSYEGTIEVSIIPFVLVDTVNYCRIDYPDTGRFLLFVNAAGRISFSIDEWGGASISTASGVAKVNEPFTAALRWNNKAKEYTLFVNGKKIGTKYYEQSKKGEFGTIMSLVHNYPAVVNKLRFSHIARPDRELIY
ncbi:hypothetical protein [Priestia megaterium]|uniref:hypothetical protein n=1 Tax=Priestia megaterium TaxID=1404 RepID=UPI001CDD0688|nr:hypothetical protein [Priestia megaterium]MCA4157641.1 hypothetical protein [Priestia megaterium]